MKTIFKDEIKTGFTMPNICITSIVFIVYIMYIVAL